VKRVQTHVVLTICLLAAIVFICFGRTLASYFLADDFFEISYVGSIFGGNYKQLLADFIGNHMHTSVMKVYRPGATLALLFDYALWRTTAWGYFLVNIMFMLACAFMLYLLLRELTKSWEPKHSILFATFSAALFAANPLHCEPVSFISSGDYLVSCFFYLLSLWCLVKNAGAVKGSFFICGIAAFWAAVLCKEAAVGLAGALLGFAFFLPEVFTPTNRQIQTGKSVSISTRLQCALSVSAPILISTAAYLALRFALLGTVSGGYTAGLGSSLMSSVMQRLTNLDTIFHVIFPLNLSVFGVSSPYGSILSMAYVAAATCVFTKLIMKRISWKWLGLLAIWAISAAAPLYQVWSLGANLEGGRFFFFLTIPLSILLPAMLFVPSAEADTETKTIDKVAAATLFILVLIYTAITYNNNIPWVHAGRQTKAFVIQGQKLAQSVPVGKRVALLGIPQELNGAHVIYNGATVEAMLSVPFARQGSASKFITFEPLFYGDPSYVNAQRLKKVLLDPNVVGLYCWNLHSLRFEPLRKPSSEELLEVQQSPQQQLNLSPICLSNGQTTASLNLDPYKYDFIELVLKSGLPKSKLPVFLYWAGSDPKAFKWCDSEYPVQDVATATSSDGTSNLRLRVSNHWQWFTQGNINKLRIEFFPGQTAELLNVRAVPGALVMPTLSVLGLQADDLGVYRLSSPGVDLKFNGSGLASCAAIKIEISKPYYSFEGSASTEDSAAIMNSLTLSGVQGRTRILRNTFPAAGYYQLRAVCLNADGRTIGIPSDPVTVGF
jgi:hypothetical protein